MNARTGKLAFGWAVFILILSGAMLFFQECGTGEFYITLATFVLAILFIGIIILAVRLSQ